MISSADEIRKNLRHPLTPWELPTLLTPVHTYRQSDKKKPSKERLHFPAILAFIYRNRFAVASQIQRRFSTILRSARTARRHLEELESLGYLSTAPGRGVGPLFPKVFYVTGRGVRRLKESLAKQGKVWNESRVDRRSRDAQEGYGSDHLIHELLVTEFLLALWQTIDGRPDLKVLNIQRRSLAKHEAFQITVSGRQTRLVPDAMFLFRQQSGGMCCCFLELDNGTMNAKQVRAKYGRYAAFSQSPLGRQYLIDLYRRYGAKEPSPTFRLLLVARSRTSHNDDGRMAELLTAARQASSVIRERIWLTTVAELCSHQHDDLPLTARLWLRASNLNWSSDAGSWRKDLNDVPRHALFSPAPLDSLRD